MTIDYELIRSRRKSVGITVYPDGRIVVRAPLRAKTADVERVVRQKSAWIRKKQEMFAGWPPPLPPRQFVDGEAQLYLGTPYPLRVVPATRQEVQLAGGEFLMHTRDPGDLARKEKLMREWYRARAWDLFSERLYHCLDRVAHLDLPTPQLRIRLMKRRWGSCGSDGRITLNLRLIQAPLAGIDYVIYHELAHLRQHNHSPAYYALLAEMLPDWQARRDALFQFPVA